MIRDVLAYQLSNEMGQYAPRTRYVELFIQEKNGPLSMRDYQGVYVLVDKPSDQVRNGPYVYPKGPYPHIQEASGRAETMMWTFERADGGRGFGFTGGHKHKNWGDDNFRKVVLNALVWIAKAEVPTNGIESSVSPEDLEKNLDPKVKKS